MANRPIGHIVGLARVVCTAVPGAALAAFVGSLLCLSVAGCLVSWLPPLVCSTDCGGGCSFAPLAIVCREAEMSDPPKAETSKLGHLH